MTAYVFIYKPSTPELAQAAHDAGLVQPPAIIMYADTLNQAWDTLAMVTDLARYLWHIDRELTISLNESLDLPYRINDDGSID